MLDNYQKKDLAIYTQVVYKALREKGEVNWQEVKRETLELYKAIQEVQKRAEDINHYEEKKVDNKPYYVKKKDRPKNESVTNKPPKTPF